MLLNLAVRVRCGSCPNRAAPNRSRCLSCLSRMSKEHGERMRSRKALGRCGQCLESVAPGHVTCLAHLRRPEFARTAEWRLEYADRVAKGICITCGEAPREAESKKCAPCRDRRNAGNRNRYEKDRSKFKDRRLRQIYGITLAEHDDMLKSQNGRCLVCGTDCPGKKGWAVDHCHTTGMVRGLLCTKCNLGIGYFDDKPERLIAAAAYLGRCLKEKTPAA